MGMAPLKFMVGLSFSLLSMFIGEKFAKSNNEVFEKNIGILKTFL